MLASALEQRVKAHSDKELKAFIVFMNPTRKNEQGLSSQAAQVARLAKTQNIGVAYLADPANPSISEYQMNPDRKVRNTVLVYRNKQVASKFVNFQANAAGLAALDAALKGVLR